METDKSNKLSKMKPETYLDSMKENVDKNEIINKQQMNKIGSKLNEHSESFVKISGEGKSHGKERRALFNVTILFELSIQQDCARLFITLRDCALYS